MDIKFLGLILYICIEYIYIKNISQLFFSIHFYVCIACDSGQLLAAIFACLCPAMSWISIDMCYGLFVLNDLRRAVVVHLVDISEIIEHHITLNFLLFHTIIFTQFDLSWVATLLNSLLKLI